MTKAAQGTPVMTKNFRHNLYIAASLAFFLTASAAHAATLSDSVSLAVSSHPQITAGQSARRAADDMVDEQKSGYFPAVRVNARAGRVDANDDTTRGNTGGNATSWLGEGGVTVTQPIFSGFSVLEGTAAATDRRDMASHQLGAMAEDIALRAIRAHLNLMRTRELLDQASNYQAAIDERRSSIALMVSEGAANEAELLQGDDVLLEARATRLGYEDAFGQAQADYIEAVGQLPAGTLELGADIWEESLPPSVDTALTQAVQDNPRLKSSSHLVAALGHETEREEGSVLPRVNAELSYLERDQDEDLGGELTNAQAMMTVSWDFYTGGAQLARMARSKQLQKEAFASAQELRRNIERDVRQKHTAMQMVNQQYEINQQREASSTKVLDNFKGQFEGGEQSNLQLLNAEARLFAARAARIDSQYRRLLARFELLNAMGRLRPTFGITTPEPASAPAPAPATVQAAQR